MFTHASWSERRSDSYARLAFLGDSVLALAVTAYLYPRLEAERFGAGRLTKIRAQAVSGPSCRAVAERLALPERLRAAAPAGRARERRCAGGDRARARLGDRGGDRRLLPARRLRAHRRGGRGGVRAGDRGRARAPAWTSSRRCRSCSPGAARRSPTRSPARTARRTSASTRSWRASTASAIGQRQRPQQEARRAGGRAHGGRAARSGAAELSAGSMRLKSLTLKGFKSFPDRTRLDFGPGVSVVVGPERLGQVQRHRRRAVGDGRAVAAGRARPVDAGRDLRRRPRRAGRAAPPRSRSCSTTPTATSTCR